MQSGFDGARLVRQLQDWGRELAFSQIGVAGVDLGPAEAGLRAWLDAGFHGSMGYMAAHGLRRARPAELVREHVAWALSQQPAATIVTA